jgi:SAM-dependent methyltransferase
MSSRLASALAAASGLLPQRTGDFGSQKYWETFFERRAGDSFEWYGSWIEFKSNLERAWGARPRDTSRTLVIGCGNSELSQQLYKAGWSTQINVDFDAGVIREMQQKTGQGYPGMQFVVMDARNLSALGGARFDFIVDKGTLDAMCTSDSADVRESVQRMLREVAGVVSPGGVYAVITLLQRHVLRELLGMSWLDCAVGAAHNGSAWASIRIEVFDDADGSSPLCPFVVVATAATAQPADPAASLRSHAAGFPVALRLPPLLGKLSGELPGSSEELNFNLRPRPLLSPLSEAAVSSVGESPDASALATVEDDVAAVLQGVVQAQVCGCWCLRESNKRICGAPVSESTPLSHPFSSPHVNTLPVQIVYSTARQIASIAKGHRVELDVWMQAASAPAAAGAVQKRKGGKAVSDVDARASGAVFITLAGASAPAELCASSAAAPPRPRFSITAVDVSSTTRVGVLLVPQGREHEWSFGSAEGQAELAAQAGFGRLLFVCMGRGHSFPGGQAAVQAELSSIVPQVCRCRPCPYRTR